MGFQWGGAGRYPGSIEGDVLFINVTGKVQLLLGVWGDWTENILSGETYQINFTGGKIALYLYYYKPTPVNAFYFKSSRTIYAYLIRSDGFVQSELDKPATRGVLREKYDSTSFLTFVRPEGVEGNITIEFWAGYEEKKSDLTGLLFVVAVASIALVAAYAYSRRSLSGRGRGRNKR